MKTRHRLSIVLLSLSIWLQDSYAQRFFYFPDSSQGGYFNLKVIDDKTGRFKKSLPGIFSKIYWDRDSRDDFVVAELGFKVSFVLDSHLKVKSVFPYGYRCRPLSDGVYLFENTNGTGALNVEGNIIIAPEYDYVFGAENGLIALKRMDTISDNCFELLAASYDGQKIQSFSIFIPEDRTGNERAFHDEGAYYRIFASDKLIEMEYANDTLAADRTFAYGLYNMYKCDFAKAGKYFTECAESETSAEQLAAAAKYNMLVCDMMLSGGPAPFPETGLLENFQRYAALNGLYGTAVQDSFCSLYELHLLVNYNRSAERRALPYTEYADKIYFDREYMHPYFDGRSILVSELLALKENFVMSEFRDSVRKDVLDGTFDTMVVSVGHDGLAHFFYNTAKEMPDDAFRTTYYMDVCRFVVSAAEKYMLDSLIMTFPY